MSQVENLNVEAHTVLITPDKLKAQLPASEAARENVRRSREEIAKVLAGADPRLLVVAGPCSIHDIDAAKEYAGRLAELARELGDVLLIVMRAYFEKPRTTTGWKGLINDPHLDGLVQDRGRLNHGSGTAIGIGGRRIAALNRGARPHHAAVPARFDRLERDRRAYHRIANTPRNGIWTQLRGWFQKTARTVRSTLRSTRCSRSPARIGSSASIRVGRLRSSKHAATQTLTSCCAAGRAAQTTIRRASNDVKQRFSMRRLNLASWWTARTPTRTKILKISRVLRPPSRGRSRMATVRSSD